MGRSFRSVVDGVGPSYGGWCSIPSTLSAEVMARGGFDWLCIDCQHGLIDYREMLGMVQVAEAAGRPALVRVSWNHPAEIMRSLDAGAAGVIVPMVETAEDAAAATASCRYSPKGHRSWGPIRASLAHAGWSPQLGNDAVGCIVQIESRRAVENLDEILAVDGLDGIYIGPADLAVSHGLAPTFQITDDFHDGLVRHILQASLDAGVPAGIHCTDPLSARTWADAGFRFVTLTSDVTLLKTSVAGAVRDVHASVRTVGPAEVS